MNAAAELAAIFRQWNEEPKSNIYNRRGNPPEDGQTLEFWSKVRRVTNLIEDLDLALDSLESIGKPRAQYDALLVRIWRFTVLPDAAWSGAHNLFLAEGDADLLETLGYVLEAYVPESNPVSETERHRVIELLGEAQAVAGECFDLPAEVRTRLTDLLANLGTLLSPENDSSVREVRRALDQATALLIRAVWAEQDKTRRGTLFGLATKFAHAMAQSGAYDAIKATIAARHPDILELPNPPERD